jgi:hypothetical protein
VKEHDSEVVDAFNAAPQMHQFARRLYPTPLSVRPLFHVREVFAPAPSRQVPKVTPPAPTLMLKVSVDKLMLKSWSTLTMDGAPVTAQMPWMVIPPEEPTTSTSAVVPVGTFAQQKPNPTPSEPSKARPAETPPMLQVETDVPLHENDTTTQRSDEAVPIGRPSKTSSALLTLPFWVCVNARAIYVTSQF